ncbi:MULTISPECIES: hypothetical protein [Streptomyces]|uniref:Uncharacterized protein n=1 Tax=Streptomyces griseosporeus TaxID=1910 RepID=A0ABV3L005_STRGS|nr:hypothetical protein [Streptomyces actuosus]
MGQDTKENADAYERIVRGQVIPGIEARRIHWRAAALLEQIVLLRPLPARNELRWQLGDVLERGTLQRFLDLPPGAVPSVRREKPEGPSGP